MPNVSVKGLESTEVQKLSRAVAVNTSPPKRPIRWTEDRVERLLLTVFGDPASAAPSAKPSQRWSHWALVATCAGMLLVVTPILMVPRDAERMAKHADDDEAAEELVVADASLSDDERSSESSGDDSEESSASEASEDDAST
jgi:hypothetical protein